MASSASRTIKSAHRVLEILEYFNQDRRVATVMDMSRTLNYPQSSTSELLRCLARLGYLHYNRFRRTYSPTARVALLGAWVKPSLFRGGPVLSAIDEIAEATGETVILSTSANYVVQHLHILHGQSEHALDVHSDDTRSLLHSPLGRLLLSSYRNEHIRSAVHRLNAEEEDAERHVKVVDVMDDLTRLREQGWIIAGDRGGTSCVAVLLPHRRHVDRLAVSVQARADVVETRGAAILAQLLQLRDRLESLALDGDDDSPEGGNVVHLPDPPRILSYRRHYA